MDILRMMICQKSYCRKEKRIRFSVTIMPPCWHIRAVTGFKKDILRTNSVKLIAKIMLRRMSRTRPSFGTSKNFSFLDQKYKTIVSVYKSTTPNAIS